MRRARKALRTGPNGAALCEDATKALGSCEGFLSTYAREVELRGSFADALHFAARFGIVAASLVREEMPRSTLEMSTVLLAAYWIVQAERDVAILGASRPGYVVKARSGESTPNGQTIAREQTVDYEERHRLAVASTTQSRHERLTLVDIGYRRAKGRKEGLVPQHANPDLMARFDRLIAAQDRAAEASRKALEAKAQVVVVEHASTARITPAEPLRSGPERTPPPVPPGASPAPSRTSPPPSHPAAAPSAPRVDQAPAAPVPMSDEEKLRQLCREWIANSGRETVEQAKACVELQSKAEGIVLGCYRAAQDAERRWERQQRRGRMPVVPMRVTWPASDWFRRHRDGSEADYAQRVFGWELETEPKGAKQ
ncbi:MAG: hypothetical protein KIS78_07880 [Labilithrix sp.]|nr:hypothetical protein [Labilithrix sp.]